VSPRPSIRHSDFGIRVFPDMPVIHEESIKTAGATKAPDFAGTWCAGAPRVARIGGAL